MKGSCLRFYVQENRRHHGRLVYEWLLECARDSGIHGGSAFRALAGFGRHGVLHEQHFFELAGELPVAVEFLLPEEQAQMLLERVRSDGLAVFYAIHPVEYGLTDAGA
jgi:PII-like signaling protein